MVRTVRVLRASAGSGAAVMAMLVAEVLWTAFRPLPTMTGLDASGIVSGAVGGSDTARGDGPVRVVAIGDSSLTGPGLTAPGDVWLRVGLHRLAHDRSIELCSLAVGGSRVVDLLARVDDAVAERPDVLVVAVGANDALHGTPRRQFRSQFRQLIERLSDAVPVVAVANVGDLGNIARVPPPLRAVFRSRARTMCSTIERIVADRDGTVLIDVTGADHVFRDRSVFTADLFHPGPVGHAAWADAALPGLRTAIQLAADGRSRLEASHS